MKKSVKEICQFFWLTERQNELLSDPSTQLLWLPFRFKFYYYITESIGLFEKAHPVDLVLSEKIRHFLVVCFDFFKKNPFLASISNNVLIPSPRKISGEDIYSEKVLSYLHDNVSIIESFGFNNSQKSTLSFAPLYVFVRIIAKFFIFISKPSRSIDKKIKRALDGFISEFNLCPNKVYALYLETRLSFVLSEKILFWFFKLKSVKVLYIVGSYFRMDFVVAAKRAGAKVIELQHGTITPYHLGYSYPDQQTLIAFPNELWCFGKFWVENTKMPIDTTFRIAGAPYINRLAKYRDVGLKKFAVVFNSQGVVGTNVFYFALSVAKKMPQLEVIFRLHPSEDLGKYQLLLKQSGQSYSNFSISHRNPNIFELMANVEYVAGVFSTTIFEAMYLGAKIILIEDSGIEYMEPVIARGEAIVVKTPEEFVLHFAKAKKSEAEYYYAAKTEI